MRSICLFFLGLAVATSAPANTRVVNGINAIVNDAVITYHEVDSAIQSAAMAITRTFPSDPQRVDQEIQKIRSEQIEEFIERQLILHEYKTGGYQLPESVFQDEIKARIRQQFHDRPTMIKTLQARGITEQKFVQAERERIMIAVLQQQNLSSSKILVSPQKIETYYSENHHLFQLGDQVKLRMIVLNQTPGNPGAARKIADEILQKINDGASFAEMATIYSEGADRARGGDRGWIDKDALRPELSEVAFSLKPGEHSQVLEFPEVCFLLFVEERRSARVRPLEEVRDEIEDTLKAQERARLHRKWISRLRNKSFIQLF
jgi:peptidyl-prolyl cis-trans isomerase SurA